MVTAFVYLDPGTPGGACVPTATGWLWNVGAAYRDSVANTKASVTGILVPVTDAQASTLAGLGAALAAAVKTEGIARGFTVTSVILPQSVVVAV